MVKNFPIVKWAIGANIYEVNIRQYTAAGTFEAFSFHILRLYEMGVSILWLMPITPISIEKRQGTLGSYYACSNYTEINPEFGDVESFKKLVDIAHLLGMKIIIDWVANHTGYDHHWTKEHPDWYLKDEHGNFTEKNGWQDVIDLDYNNQAMQDAMIEAMQYWVKKCKIDGFRCDMAHLVPIDFWIKARKKCDAIKPLFWLAECENNEYYKAFDVTYAWNWMHALDKYFKQEITLKNVWAILDEYAKYSNSGIKLFFTSNHDENSWNGTEYEKYGKAAKVLAVFTCTWNGISLIYSGQENPNYKRLNFFEKDRIEWNKIPELHYFYKRLLFIRKSKAVIEGGTFIIPTQNENVIAFLRRKSNDVVLVLLNLSNEDKIKITVNHVWFKGIFQNLFSEFLFSFDTTAQFELSAYEYRIYNRVI